jgi:hypothetical protein
MPFVWESSGVGTYTKSEQTYEIMHNVDHIIGHLSASSYSWSEIPASAGSLLEAIDIDEIKDAVDHVVSHNYCSTHCVSHFTDYCFGYLTSDNPSHLITYNLNNLSSDDNGQLSVYCVSNLANVETGYCSANYTSVQASQRYTEKNSAAWADNTGVYGGNWSGECNGWNGVDHQRDFP